MICIDFLFYILLLSIIICFIFSSTFPICVYNVKLPHAYEFIYMFLTFALLSYSSYPLRNLSGVELEGNVTKWLRLSAGIVDANWLTHCKM